MYTYNIHIYNADIIYTFMLCYFMTRTTREMVNNNESDRQFDLLSYTYRNTLSLGQ